MFTRSRAARSSRRCSIEKSLLLLCLLLYVDAATLAFATTALLLIYGRYYNPWAIAIAGGFASALGSATQLLLLRWVLAGDKPWMRRFRPSREKFEAALRQFPSASFLALVVARATPLPDAPLKLVAAAVGYPISHYTLAVLIGSLPYYFALAWLGKLFHFPLWLLAAAVGVVLLALLVDRLL